MSARSNVAALLRATNVSPVIGWVEDHLFWLQREAFLLAERLDPSTVDYDTADWPDLTSWAEEVIKPQQEAVSAAVARMLARMDPYPIEFEIPRAFVDWKDPVTPDIEGVTETVRKAFEDGQPIPAVDMESFREAARQVKFEPFDTTDVQPFIDRINTFAADLARQVHEAREAPMVEWLEEVGGAVGDFGPDTAREIVRRRDELLP